MIHYNELVRDEIETANLGSEKNVLVEKINYDGPNVFLDHDENDQTTAKYLKLITSEESHDRRYLDDVNGLIDGVKNGIGRALVPEHLIKGEKDIVDRKNPLFFQVILHFFKQPYYSGLHEQVVAHLKIGCRKYLG